MTKNKNNCYRVQTALFTLSAAFFRIHQSDSRDQYVHMITIFINNCTYLYHQPSLAIDWVHLKTSNDTRSEHD